MKIAIPVSEKSMEASINDTFGRSTYFLVYDDESENAEYIDNKAATSQGGAGIKAAQTLVDENVDYLITPRCGQNAAEVLESANIKMYESNTDSVKKNLNLLKSGKLNELKEIHEGFHGNKGRGRR